jgi:hypothetical protein
MLGRCIVEHREAVLHVTSVRDATTNEEIAEIAITGLEIDGRSYPIEEFALPQSQNVEFRDSLFICSVPFSFGTREGSYLLSVSAEGYVDRDVEIADVHYAVREGPGCPLYLDGGTRVRFTMERKKGRTP